MKKTLLGLLAIVVLGAPAARAIDFCCGVGNEDLCCAQLGKKYCPSEKACRTKCVEELCPEGYVYNNQTLKCEREVECTAEQTTCGNKCCDAGSYCADVATRLCCIDGAVVYSNNGVPDCCSKSCPGNWELDTKICDCTSCVSLKCTGNRVKNEGTCECDCPITSCEDEDYMVDEELCECVKAGEPCATNGDCSDRAYCNNGVCKACHGDAQYFIEGYGCSECKTDAECSDGKSCIEHACTLSNALCYAWQYKSEEQDACVGCPENANCDGTNVACYTGYVKNVADGFTYCCKANQYFTGVYCSECPENATCNGGEEVRCNEPYKESGSVKNGTFACLACEGGKYYLGEQCVDCLDNAYCDGVIATCKPGYAPHNLGTAGGVCCNKTTEYYDGTKCQVCIEHATCDGTNINPMQGYRLDGNKVVACATDGSVCEGCPVTAKYWNGSACVACMADENCAETETCVGNVCKHKEAQCDVGYYWYEEWGDCRECRQDWYPNSICNGLEYKCAEGYALNIPGCSENMPVCCPKNQYAYIECGVECYDCPEGMECDGTENRKCKEGYVENGSYGWISCCRSDQYWTDCNYECYDCPAGATCDGKNVVCGEALPHIAGGSCEGYRCVKCTDNSHCPAGKVCSDNSCVSCKVDEDTTCSTCPSETPYWNGSACVRCMKDENCPENGVCKDSVCEMECTEDSHCPDGKDCEKNRCIDCVTDGSKTCVTCTDEEARYWNGTECVRCINDSHCDKSGTCSENTCVGQTNCNAGEYWNEDMGGCRSCPSDATCYKDEITCDEGYELNKYDSYYVECCNKQTEYWSNGDYSEPGCRSCPENAICDGTDFTCSGDYVKASGGYEALCCHKEMQYYSSWNGCVDCPENATCDGLSVTCNGDFPYKRGEEYEGNIVCYACDPSGGQYRVDGQCYDCPSNAYCDGETASCRGGYTAHNEGTSSMVCCYNSNQYYSDGECHSCPTGAICDGTNIKAAAGYYLEEGNVPAECAADGTKCVGCGSKTPYWNGSSCVGCMEGVACPDGYTCTDDFKCMIEGAACESVDQFYHEYDGRCYRCDGQDYYSCCDSLGYNDGAYRGVCDGTNFDCQDGYVPNHGKYGYYSCCRKDQYYDGEGNYSEPGCRTCPENAVCDGTESVECKTGYVENEYGPSLFCCAENQYFSSCEWRCMDCPEGGTCDGKTVTCGGDFPYKVEECSHWCAECTEDGHCPEGSYCSNRTCIPCSTTGSTCGTCTDSDARYWNGTECVPCVKDSNCPTNGKCENYECKMECTEDSHCETGKDCENNLCIECVTDGSKTCVTCTDEDARYWNGKECVRCIKDSHCDLSGTCSNYSCVGKTNCDANYYWHEKDGACYGCPENATCYKDEVTCKNGYKLNTYNGGTERCCPTSQYFYKYSYYEDYEEGYCSTCPENAICDGSDFICRNGYVKMESGYSYSSSQCCRKDQFYSNWYGGCRDCPLNATCENGQVTCDDGFTFTEEDGGYCYSSSASNCKYGQFYRYNRCYPCEDDPVAVEGLTAEQCAKCPNRSWDGKYCYKEPPECASTEYWGVEGERCWACSENTWRSAVKSECETCPERYLRTDGQCWLCSNSDTGTTTFESCNRCQQRYWREDNGQCPMCPSGAVKDATGKGCVCPSGQTWNASSNSCG